VRYISEPYVPESAEESEDEADVETSKSAAEPANERVDRPDAVS
jgi:hypothetical protein